MLNQLKGAYQREVDDFLLAVHRPQSVSAAAVCKARHGLKPSVFSELNAQLLVHAAELVPPIQWRQKRVLAVDGSVLNLPHVPGMFEHFGGQRMGEKQGGASLPMARFSQLYDVSSGLSLHACLQPYALGEAVAVAEHLEHAPADALVLYDRGYPSFFLVAQHAQHQRDFCMRVPRGFSQDTDALFALDATLTSLDFLLKPNRSARALCAEHALPDTPVRVRAVRVALPMCIEVLITSLLDDSDFPDASFGALYAQRWGIEGDFRHLKARMQMENWTGKSPLTVQQDVFARVLTKNMVAIVQSEAQRRLDSEHARAASEGETKHRAKVNATAALHLCKFQLIAYLLAPTQKTLEPLVKQVLKNANAQRPGRSFPRQEKRGKSNRYPMPYKQTR